MIENKYDLREKVVFGISIILHSYLFCENRLKTFNQKIIKIIFEMSTFFKQGSHSLIFILAVSLLATGCKKESVTIPVLTTGTIDGITLTSAVAHGTITSDGGGDITTRGICYNTSPGVSTANLTVADGVSGTGSYTCTLTGLTRATVYYARAYAINSAGIAYGNEVSFSTGAVAPTLTTTNISSVSTTSAVSGGDVTDDGGKSVTKRGVCWSSANMTPTIDDNSTDDGTGSGSFASDITGLEMNTTYYVRAYATNQEGTAYGDALSFTTKGYPVVRTRTVSDFIGDKATSGCVVLNDGGYSITAKGICWNTSGDPTLSDHYVINTDTVGIMINLVPGTVYHVRAYATNDVGTAYGEDIVFNSGQLIGSSYAGGLVAWNDGNGGGLVFADVDQSTSAPWGCQGTFITLTQTGFGTGATNTQAIVDNCADLSTAARICHDLTLNGYDDWFLPSKDEMSMVYNIILPAIDIFYWTSSEASADNAYAVGRSSGAGVIGLPPGTAKSTLYRVRAVRVF